LRLKKARSASTTRSEGPLLRGTNRSGSTRCSGKALGEGDLDTLRLNGANEDEIHFLRQARVELNAFTSDQLVAWLEGKLEEHGITKVAPVAPAVAEARRARRW
jgi:hypothetical protein